MFKVLTLLLLSAGGPPGDAIDRLADATVEVAEVLTLEGRWDAAAALVEPALSLARERGNARQEARLGAALGSAWLELATHRGAPFERPLGTLEQALRRAQDSGDAAARGRALDALGRAHYWRRLTAAPGGDGYEKAEALFREAASVRQAAGDEGAALSSFHVGVIHERRREYDQAARVYADALERAERAGDRLTTSYALRHLAFHEARAGRHEAALAMHGRSRALREAVGFRIGVAFARLAAGDAMLALGRSDEAVQQIQAALAEGEALGSRRGVAMAHLSLAEAWGAKGDLDRQIDNLAKALEASESMGFRTGQQQALEGLATAHEKKGEPEQARAYRERTARPR